MAEELAFLGNDLRTAIGDILAGLAVIDASTLPARDRRTLDRAHTASMGLLHLLEKREMPPPPHAAFARLLEIAGPEMANELIAQFQNDLTEVQTRLTAALPVEDWTNVRGASHVLIALAGTAGAQELEATARALNLAANDCDSAGAAQSGPPALQGLSALMRFITQIATDRSAHT